MKHTKRPKMSRQLLSVVLCAVLALGLLSVGAFAAPGPVAFADDPFVGGDSVTETVSEKIETDGGVGVDVRSNNDPVNVTVSGGVEVHEATAETAIGVRAVAVAGGTAGLTLSGGVSAESGGIAYGAHLETSNDAFIVCYCEPEPGRIVPLMEDYRVAFPTLVTDGENDVSSDFAVGDDTNPFTFFAKIGDDEWDLFLIGSDGRVTAWSKTPVSEQTIREFSGYISGTETLEEAVPITVTICTPDGGEEGTELTLEAASEKGRAILYDAFGSYYIVIKGDEDLVRKPTRDNSEPLLPFFMYDAPVLGARVSGTVSAQAEKACAMNVLPYRGAIDLTLSDAELVGSGETWAWGVNAKATKTLTLTGSNVTIRATGAEGAPSSSVLGLMLSVAAHTTNVELTGENSICVAAEAAPGPGEYSGGIVAYAGGATLGYSKAGVCNVRYEGSISASGVGMVGVEALAAMGGTTDVTVIGDVSLTDSDSDGVYVCVDKRLPMYTPKSELYLRGSITLTGASGEAAGVSVFGSTAIVDGNVSVEGTGDLMGVYADVGLNQLKTQGSTVLVTGTITAPTAVFIAPDDGTITNDSRVYVWNTEGELGGKTENVGYVVKLADGLTATPESDSLFCVEKDGKTYYGADRGDAVTIRTESDIRVVSARGVQLPVMRTDGGWTFVMPEDCGVTVSAQPYIPVIVVPQPAEDPDSVSFPAAAVRDAAAEGAGLRAETRSGTVKLDAATVQAAAEAGRGIKVTVKAADDGTTTVSVTAGGQAVDAPVKLELPAPEGGRVPVLVDADGGETVVKKSLVEDGKLYAVIPANATVRFTENVRTFIDVADGDWFAAFVDFVSGRGLFEGTDRGFEPDGTMTRAMLATVLYRLEDAAATGTNLFADIPDGVWYTEAANWTGETGIIRGTDKGFEPEQNVTREQIAAILFRYADLIGLDTDGRSSLSVFSDGDQTSDWAKDAMAWAVCAGLFEGSDGALDPGGSATRAQVAAILQRLTKLIVM